MTKDADLIRLAEEVAERTVAKTFKGLGLDTDDPISVQGQFAFLRNMYHTARHARNVVITAALGIVVTGIGWAIWGAVKAPAAVGAVTHLAP